MYAEGGTAFVSQWYDMGIKIQILGGDPFDDPKMIKNIANKGEVLYSVSRQQENKDFGSKLLALTGDKSVPICSSQAYDAVMVLANAIQNAGTLNPDTLQEYIRKTSLNGVSGLIEFDQNADLTQAAYVVKRARGGVAEEVK
jgi:branched-chain amino acid transport system substrate-binding protein